MANISDIERLMENIDEVTTDETDEDPIVRSSPSSPPANRRGARPLVDVNGEPAYAPDGSPIMISEEYFSASADHLMDHLSDPRMFRRDTPDASVLLNVNGEPVTALDGSPIMVPANWPFSLEQFIELNDPDGVLEFDTEAMQAIRDMLSGPGTESHPTNQLAVVRADASGDTELRPATRHDVGRAVTRRDAEERGLVVETHDAIELTELSDDDKWIITQFLRLATSQMLHGVSVEEIIESVCQGDRISIAIGEVLRHNLSTLPAYRGDGTIRQVPGTDHILFEMNIRLAWSIRAEETSDDDTGSED